MFADQALDQRGKDVMRANAGGEMGIQGLRLRAVAQMQHLIAGSGFNIGWRTRTGSQKQENERAAQKPHAVPRVIDRMANEQGKTNALIARAGSSAFLLLFRIKGINQFRQGGVFCLFPSF